MEYEIKPKEKFEIGVEELWKYKELFFFFTWRDIKIKYKQTSLGLAWVIIQPVLMTIIFSFFLGNKIYKNDFGVPYPAFVFSGLIIWTAFSNGISTSSNSLVTNSNIIKKIYFPRLILPVSCILVSLFDFVLSILVFVGILIYYQIDIHFIRLIVLFPLSIICLVITTFGMGVFLSALNIKYKDFKYIIPFLLQILLFISPVIYSLSSSKPVLNLLISLNPLYCPITLFRSAFYNNPLDLSLIFLSFLSSILVLFFGVIYFKKTEMYFSDIA